MFSLGSSFFKIGGEKMKVIVGNAWPYSNGELHIGRISSWLPGDVIARYHRAKGDDVIFISGADCHGELVLKKANAINKSPRFVSDYYYEKFRRNFSDLDFSFDNFAKTSGEYHIKEVRSFIEILNKKGFIYVKSLDVDKLFFKLSAFEHYIESLVNKNLLWRDCAINLTRKYLDEGLRDKVLSRDIEWGIEIPIKGFEDEKVFVWIEAVMGYLTASKKVIEDRKEYFDEYWNSENSRVYLFHGKENIPFHTILMPSIIAGLGFDKCNLRILSSEHMDLEGKQFSTNRNWVVWVDYLIKNYDVDTIRYYLLTHGAEKRKSNFTWRDFINTHNTQLLGIYGNFVNRTLSFIDKHYNGSISKQRINRTIEKFMIDTYSKTSEDIEKGNLTDATNRILNLVIKGNEYFDREKPWILFRNDPDRCREVIYTCALIVLNLANLLNPFIPRTASKIRRMIGYDKISYNLEVVEEFNIKKVKFLFNRIERRKANEEFLKLKANKF